MRRVVLALAAVGTAFAGLAILPKAEATPVERLTTNCEITELPAPVTRPAKVQSPGTFAVTGSLDPATLTWTAPKAKAADIVRYEISMGTTVLSSMVCPTPTTWTVPQVARGVDVTFTIRSLGHRDAAETGNPAETSNPVTVTLTGTKVRLRTKVARGKVRIRGKVLDTKGAGVPVVLNKVVNGKLKAFKTVTTDHKGAYTLRRKRTRTKIVAVYAGGPGKSGNRSPRRAG